MKNSYYLLLFSITLNFLINNHKILSQGWSPIGSGVNGSVYALGVHNSELIAGGNFTTAGGITANRIAKWNGTNWSALGTGMNESVWALTVYNGELIAGGWFTSAGGVNANYIARWNGTNWAPLGTGTNNRVFSLTVYNNELIAGGDFTEAGGISANHIAKWNSTTNTKKITENIPEKYKLSQNYPNPFNNSTLIKFQCPKSENVILKVLDINGKEIASLVNEHLSAGNYSVTFNGGNLSSGIYFYKLTAGNFTEIKTMILVK